MCVSQTDNTATLENVFSDDLAIKITSLVARILPSYTDRLFYAISSVVLTVIKTQYKSIYPALPIRLNRTDQKMILVVPSSTSTACQSSLNRASPAFHYLGQTRPVRPVTGQARREGERERWRRRKKLLPHCDQNKLQRPDF